MTPQWINNSVRPNTEYSAKIGRIFGAEYSAKMADTPIPKKRRKFAIFATFQHFSPRI